MPRKPLIEAGSLLPSQATESGGDVMSRIIARDREKRTDNPLADTPLHADSYTEENTEKSAYAITEGNAEEHTEDNADVNTDIVVRENTDRQTQRRKGIKRESKPPASTPAETSLRQKLIQDLQREPVVRKTIDIPASLNERLQDYCAAKRIKTERRVFLVLLESFLEEEGF